MPKGYKSKNGNYIDSSSIVHNHQILKDILYPVGSVYISVNNTNPQTFYGGTWEQIKDRFLLACGDTYSNGVTGGEAQHTLTVDEMPSHTHTYDITSNDGAEGWARNGNWNAYGQHTTGSTGGGQAHNNMPPYLAVYVWKRTA